MGNGEIHFDPVKEFAFRFDDGLRGHCSGGALAERISDVSVGDGLGKLLRPRHSGATG
jgi:hypothetical protein